ncbi:ankyrin repeat domain-containing protein SOWAHC isoform X1 [Anopheles arabiensis]|uniref:ankyrin repeat domain-containing protein SOWAHC isoform X1 n=1 Tax=Anopheles arabiensis TaxID=7173 RepID=UPI001AAC6149|nr:ankyrin repeat domain-containing protein SOWAHC isoform X1 [Anopheles arabiensis]
MDTEPKELSMEEIRKFMVLNNYKLTNHTLVKHFRSFLTNKDTQDEARRRFKEYVNKIASVKHEGNEKYLVLRRKYYNGIPPEDAGTESQPMSPASRSYGLLGSDSEASPLRQPPPYRPPPVVSPDTVSYQGSPRGSIALNRRNSSDYVRSGSEISFGSEFASVDSRKVNPLLVRSNSNDTRSLPDGGRKPSVDMMVPYDDGAPPAIPPRKRVSESGGSIASNSRQNSVEERSTGSVSDTRSENKENVVSAEPEEKGVVASEENKLSVKEKMMKFNRFASEEEAKIPSPIGKKKPDKNAEETLNTENLMQHPNAKEWLIAAAKSDYQLLAKLSTEHPNLVKLQDISTGYTALHWAAKHGNEDVVKLVAGKLKADVNARTNGGYTALHIATQFGRNDIFELLCNVYKADRDLLDWSGKKALEYQKQMTSVSESTFSKIKARKKHSEKDSGFLRIGSLNVRVKKTTEAFSNFLGVGTNQTRIPPTAIRSSAPPDTLFIDKLHKSWGSADNIQKEDSAMPPPKYGPVKKRRQKRDIEYDPSNDHFSQSVPTTPSQIRAPVGPLSENPDGESMGDSDSDTACGFDSNWRPTYI